MVTVQAVLEAINRIAPFRNAEEWDNCGLLTGDPGAPVSRIWVCLDATAELAAEAARQGVSLLVTHHPVIFQPLRRLTAPHPVYTLARGGVSVISAHTNLDLAQGGVNDCLAFALSLQNLRPLQTVRQSFYNKIVVFVPQSHLQTVYAAMSQAGAGRQGLYEGCGFFHEGKGCFTPLPGSEPFIGAAGVQEQVEEVRLEMICSADDTAAVITALRSVHPYEEPAYDILETKALSSDVALGRIGTLPQPLAPEAFALYVKERLGCGGVELVEGCRRVSTVALCGGAGGSLLDNVYTSGVDAYVTSELKHNQLLEARAYGLTLINAGHFYTERVVLPSLRDRLADLFPQVDVTVQGYDVSPVRYL